MTTTTGTAAYDVMRAHHSVLDQELSARADAVSIAVAAERPYDAAVAAVIAYLGEAVLPHAWAEEKTIYAAAVAHTDLGDMVGEMVAEHVFLSAAASRLAVVTDGATAARQAQQIAGHFAAHAAKENDVLLPALLADRSVDLAGLLDEMHRCAGGGTPEGDSGSAAADPDLDVRELPPARRHTTIFDAYDALVPGTGFVLVNDHDPKPLGYQFEAEHAGEFTWDYLESGPEVWRVRIGRAGA